MTDHALAETRAWVDRAVIGLQLCPFAKAPQVKEQVRYVVSEAVDPIVAERSGRGAEAARGDTARSHRNDAARPSRAC